MAIREQALGPNHPNTATSLNNLAMVLSAQGDDVTAQQLFERVLAIREQVLGSNHPDTAASLNNLAELLRNQGDYIAAGPLYERALAIAEQELGPDHPKTGTSLNNLALLYANQGDLLLAKPLMERAAALYLRALGPTHPHTQQMQKNLDTIRQTAAQAIVRFNLLSTQEGDDSDNRSDLARRAEAAVEKALASGTAEERATVAEKLDVSAEAYAHGDAADRILADRFRALAARLRA